MKRRVLSSSDFSIEKSDKGYYFRWNLWNEGSGVGFWKTKTKATSEMTRYINMHNQGSSLHEFEVIDV